MSTPTRFFRYASLVHLIVASMITLLIAYEPLEIPRIIAGGRAGTWFTMGYLMYLIAGPLGNLYLSIVYGDRRSSIGLLAFLLYNAGVLIASLSLIYAGYHAGWMMHVYPVHHQGKQVPIEQIHLWLVNFVLPAAIGTVLAGLGALMGALGALMPGRRGSS